MKKARNTFIMIFRKWWWGWGGIEKEREELQFPVAAITNNHKHGDLKQNKLILSLVTMSEIHVSAGPCSSSFCIPLLMAASLQFLPLSWHWLLLCAVSIFKDTFVGFGAKWTILNKFFISGFLLN